MNRICAVQCCDLGVFSIVLFHSRKVCEQWPFCRKPKPHLRRHGRALQCMPSYPEPFADHAQQLRRVQIRAVFPAAPNLRAARPPAIRPCVFQAACNQSPGFHQLRCGQRNGAPGLSRRPPFSVRFFEHGWQCAGSTRIVTSAHVAAVIGTLHLVLRHEVQSALRSHVARCRKDLQHSRYCEFFSR